MRLASGGSPSSPGVLVVDDDQGILKLLDPVLRLHGFTPWLASSGQEAQDLYRQHATEIAAVLLDVRMAGMDGPQTLAAIRLVNPAVRFCFMTGDSGDYPEEELLKTGSPCILKKPFRLEEVVRVIEQLIRDQPALTTDPMDLPPQS
jgi:CheY-like chemotaxis protein